MKRGKIKVVFIYLLVLVLIGLVSYLIYFINNQTPAEPKATEKPVVQNEKVSNKCTFDITQEEYNTLSSNPSSLALCQGKNKLNITNISLNNTPASIYAYYKNGILSKEDTTLGLYINDSKIVDGNKNIIGIFNNLLFVKNIKEYPNILVFNSNGKNLYDLENILISNQINDPVFTELAKTNQAINTRVSLENIDDSSFAFGQTEFTFNTTTTACREGQAFKGSTYKVAFNGETFTLPTFVANVNC